MQIQIRKRNLDLTPELAGHIERRLRFSLGAFTARLRSAVVQLEDINGPKGGVDQTCKLTVMTKWHYQIVIDERDANISVAVARAARAVERQTALRYGSDPRPARFHFGD